MKRALNRQTASRKIPTVFIIRLKLRIQEASQTAGSGYAKVDNQEEQHNKDPNPDKIWDAPPQLRADGAPALEQAYQQHQANTEEHRCEVSIGIHKR